MHFNCFLSGEQDDIDVKSGDTPVFSIFEAPVEHLSGFLWLKLEDKYLTQWEKLCLRRHVGTEGCSLLSSKLWKEKLRATLQQSMAIKQWAIKISAGSSESTEVTITVENNGPALTVDVFTKDKAAKGCCNNNDQNERRYFYADFTLGLHCKSWPKKAKGRIIL